ncbi:V-set and transmembrane domain-containing protein 5 [Megalops cyprinoides]|uniref:V-set and transmembrane domain-containing protein 5 n=1 Tax=Megalops cyprinoides TaxID=118141 RepID=UPI00186441AA|nr:V-set and transmembrane domain-containing protein 5 [Megalops cyprinoides]
MWPQRDGNAHLTILLCAMLSVGSGCLAQAITITTPEYSLVRSVQEDVLISVDFECHGTPTIKWAFMSARERRNIVVWQPGLSANVSEYYQDRLQTHTNGSITLLDLRLTDSGYYVVTVSEPTGSSKDAAVILKVEEVLYEDLQYLAVFATVLGAMAGFLMVSMWLLDKVYWRVKEWRQRSELPENEETELQSLRSTDDQP